MEKIISVLLISIIALSSCSDDDKQLSMGVGDLPLSSQEFLTKYFPDNKVVTVSRDKSLGPPDLRSTQESMDTETAHVYVLLEGNIRIVFSQNNGNWMEVYTPDGIPSSATEILDEHVYLKLTRKEPQTKITTLLPFYDHSITITLDNGHRYAQTRLLAYNGTTLAEANITDENIPMKIADFLTRNQLRLDSTMGQVFKITETEGTAYRLFIGNAIVISFDENANWIHAEINDFNNSSISGAEKWLNRMAENEMPSSISDALKYESNLGGIRIIASYGNGNYGLRFTNKDLLVNENTGIVPPPISTANRLISDYYDSSYKLLYHPRGITYVGAYEYSSTFVYDGKENHVSIEVDMKGDWTRIESAYIEKGKAIYVSLPSKIIEELPAATINYLKENYKDREIYSLSHNLHAGNKEYTVYIDKKYLLYFNADGSFRMMIQVSLYN